MDPTTTGQRIIAAVVEIAFLTLIGFLARYHAIPDGTLTSVISIYATGKFGAGIAKYASRILPPPGGGSGQYQYIPVSVPQPPVTEQRAPITMPGATTREDVVPRPGPRFKPPVPRDERVGVIRRFFFGEFSWPRPLAFILFALVAAPAISFACAYLIHPSAAAALFP